MNDVFVWEECGVDGSTKKPWLGVFVKNYANEPSFVRPATSADVAVALNSVGAEAVREVWHGLESRAYGVALISAHGALANAIKRAEEAERERDEAINRADRAEELLESACEPMDAARVVRERDEAIRRAEQAEAQAIEDRSARDEAQYRWGEALEELQVTKNLLKEERRGSGNEALQKLQGDLSYVKGSLKVEEHLVEVFRKERKEAQETAAAENKAATGLRLEIESIGKALGKHDDDESVLAAAERVVRARDLALDLQRTHSVIAADHPIAKARDVLGARPDEPTTVAIERVVKERDEALDRAAATGLSTDQPSQAFLARVHRCLQVKPGEMTLDAAERIVRERDEAIDREKELGIFFRTADRVISEVRSALGIPAGPHVVEEVARVVKERDKAKRFMEVAHRQVDIDLSLITDVCEILGAKRADVLRETAARVVKDRDELLERSQAMITEVFERLGAAPMEPLHDLLTRVSRRSNESERIIASLSSGRKEFKNKLREANNFLDEACAERDEALNKLRLSMERLGQIGEALCKLENESVLAAAERVLNARDAFQAKLKQAEAQLEAAKARQEGLAADREAACAGWDRCETRLREANQILEEIREERDKAILKGLEEKNQTLGWLAAIPGVTVCAAESVHDRIQRVKLEIDRLNRHLDITKDRADKAEEARDAAQSQLSEELRLAKEDRDLALSKLHLMCDRAQKVLPGVLEELNKRER